ncbi:unnamed protein product [Caenorhabditis sp. 36 PRJEB53466]|nr:unnamed protein product [Caenorhabditis sp. 36 PRJEB53466]
MRSTILFVLFVIFVISYVATASSSTEQEQNEINEKEEQTSVDNLLKFLSERRHNRLEHHKHDRLHRVCGAKAIRRVFRICPDGCTVKLNTFLPTLCAYGLSDNQITSLCCPSAEDE